MLNDYNLFSEPLNNIKEDKLLITTLNAHSYNLTKSDDLFREALRNSSILLPDGISVVVSIRWLFGLKLQKIAGADLFFYEMARINAYGGSCFFLGSTVETLNKITKKANIEFPNTYVHSYSPPYKTEFSAEDNEIMINKINAVSPNVLFVGMTAPKQEKWSYTHFSQLHVGHVCCIGAVFDFYAGTVKRAPQWMIKTGLEWLYRLIQEPKRMWKRYLIGNLEFTLTVLKEKFNLLST